MDRLKQLIHEIHRRSLWQVLGIYLVASWAVLQVVDTLGGALNLPDWFPSFALALLLVGLPIVLATAFVQEGGPEVEPGAAVSEPGVSGAAGSFFTWRNAIGGGVLAFATWGVVAAGWVLFSPGSRPAATGVAVAEGEAPAIAVLPFENMSGSEDDQYFTDGMHEEILTRLSKIGGLRVISRTSVLGYENAPANLREIARDLGVGFIGEGSVRRAQDQVRVTVQLIDAATDEHLWAETYDRELDPAAIFAIQSDVAQRIASAMRTQLSPEEQLRVAERPTDSQEAYELYLLSQALVQQGRSDEEREALTTALEIDPNFTDAWASLATSHIFTWWSTGGDRTEARREMARAALQRAEDLDPSNVPYLAARAAYAYYILEDYQSAVGLYEQVIDRQPNHAFAWAQIAYTRRRLGDFAGAIEAFTVGARLDPGVRQTLGNLATTYSLVREWDDANAVRARYHTGWPDYLLPWESFTAGTIVYRQGDVAGAREDIQRVIDAGGSDYSLLRELSRTYTAERQFEEALVTLQQAQYEVRESPESVEPKALLVGDIQRLMGRPEEARQSYLTAQALLEERLREDPNDRRTLASLGLALAGLGEAGTAIEAGRRAVEILPVEEDAIAGTIYLERLARIYSLVGEHEVAIEILDDLLGRPSFLTVARLRMEPDWDPVREHPRFQALLED